MKWRLTHFTIFQDNSKIFQNISRTQKHHVCVYMYLGANAVITAVQKGTDVPQVIADGIHRGIIFDVDINECCDERSRQLLASDHYILKTCSFHLLLKLLQSREKSDGVSNKRSRNKGGLALCTRFLATNKEALHSGRHVDECRSMSTCRCPTGEVFVHICTFGSSDIMRLNWWSQRSFQRARVW